MIYPWQAEHWQRFCQQKLSDRVAHSILITGVEGIGKVHFAEHLISSLHCTEVGVDSEPCLNCHNCRLLIAGNHPDHSIVQPENNSAIIKIDQIRELKEKQALTSNISKWKTVLVLGADKMNINANNSLLKLLEEPQDNTVIVLVSSHPEQLPITIRSRCQQINLTPPADTLLEQWIQTHADVDTMTIHRAAKLANQAPLLTLHYLQEATLDSLTSLENDFEALLLQTANPVLMAKEWLEMDLHVLFNYLQLLLKGKLLELADDIHNEKQRHYWHVYDCILSTMKLLSSPNNINKTLVLEQFLVSVMQHKHNTNATISR